MLKWSLELFQVSIIENNSWIELPLGNLDFDLLYVSDNIKHVLLQLNGLWLDLFGVITL